MFSDSKRLMRSCAARSSSAGVWMASNSGTALRGSCGFSSALHDGSNPAATNAECGTLHPFGSTTAPAAINASFRLRIVGADTPAAAAAPIRV